MADEEEVDEILSEDKRRKHTNESPFNPITGEGSILPRTRIVIFDFPIKVQWVPDSMMEVPLVKGLVKAGSVQEYYETVLKEQCEESLSRDGNAGMEGELEYDKDAYDMIVEEFVRIRIRYDFPFWAALLVQIHPKGGGDFVHFVLNRPQRKLVTEYERQRLLGMPIRLILLKARQWGGSTVTQMYFAWLQLVHKTGLNSLIVSHVLDSSNTILDMYKNMLEKYPTGFLHDIGASYDANEKKWQGVGQSNSLHEIPQRNCKIKVGTAEKPDNDRSGDYNLVHLSEVGVWKRTEGKTPEELIQGATSGIPLLPYTMIVIESTAKGVGNYFHQEYMAAKEGNSQFHPFFVAWFEIELYEKPFADESERRKLAERLWENRQNKNVMSNREEPGAYLWWLWKKGCTLEQINWYVFERKKFTDHGQMASEYPSDEIEAFVNSGQRVFDRYQVDAFRHRCCAPMYIGDVYGKGDEGKEAFVNLHFKEDHQGLLWVWEKPDISDDEIITDRYITAVDIGGRSNKADWSVIVVFDRLPMMDGGNPRVVAQWYGHCDIDLLAWKAAQVAKWYDNSLLVIESNTLETHDKERQVDGDQSQYVLNAIKDVYPNLYERKKSGESVDDGEQAVYGFHTNVKTKPMIISNLIKIVRDGLYTERDGRCLDEYLTYERKDNGAFGAVIGKHDDLLMTRAIGLWVCYNEMDMPEIRKKEDMIQKRSYGSSEAVF